MDRNCSHNSKEIAKRVKWGMAFYAYKMERNKKCTVFWDTFQKCGLIIFKVLWGLGFGFCSLKVYKYFWELLFSPIQKEKKIWIKNLDELQMQESNWMGDDSRPNPEGFLSLLQPGHLLLFLINQRSQTEVHISPHRTAIILACIPQKTQISLLGLARTPRLDCRAGPNPDGCPQTSF